jgi:hypothetical protein
VNSNSRLISHGLCDSLNRQYLLFVNFQYSWYQRVKQRALWISAFRDWVFSGLAYVDSLSVYLLSSADIRCLTPLFLPSLENFLVNKNQLVGTVPTQYRTLSDMSEFPFASLICSVCTDEAH